VSIAFQYGGVGRRNQRESSQLPSHWFLVELILFDCEDVPPKRRLTLDRPEGVLSQKKILFLSIATVN
jgi:hypothetical protein